MSLFELSLNFYEGELSVSCITSHWYKLIPLNPLTPNPIPALPELVCSFVESVLNWIIFWDFTGESNYKAFGFIPESYVELYYDLFVFIPFSISLMNNELSKSFLP